MAGSIGEALNDMRRRRLFSTKGHRKLRATQKRCIRYLATIGTSVSTIAEDLHVSPTTVRRAICA
jgi:DNA-binding MarR family transcriptional regulator